MIPWTYFPPISNREDWLQTLQIWDDDQNTFVNITGCTGSGTFSAWTVLDGTIATTSSTTITVGPNAALALIVGVGLAIQAGDLVQLTETVGRSAIITGTALSYNISTGALVLQVGWTFEMELRRMEPRTRSDGYSSFYSQVGVELEDQPVLTLSLVTGGSGISYVGTGGFLQVLALEKIMKGINPGTYRASMTGFDGFSTRQIFSATLPIYYGGVTN